MTIPILSNLHALSIQDHAQHTKSAQNQQITNSPALTTPQTQTIKQLIKTILESNNNQNKGLIIKSNVGGLGKSHTTIQTLTTLLNPDDFAILSGYKTPISLYTQLYHARNKKVVVLDDCPQIWKDEKIISILKNATWSAIPPQTTTTGQHQQNQNNSNRILEYHSTTQILEKHAIPSAFEFSPAIIIITNETTTNNSRHSHSVQALINRCFYYEITLTHTDILNLLADFAKIPYPNTTETQRTEVLQFLTSHTTITTRNISFRTIIKIYALINSHPKKEEWQNLALLLLESDPEL